MDLTAWWTRLDARGAAAIVETWIPVGAPGFAGPAKARWRSVLDKRFGSDGWRIAYVIRGRIEPFAVAIAEYEASYRAYLRDRPALVRFLVEQCGNVYDDRIENVHDVEYEQP